VQNALVEFRTWLVSVYDWFYKPPSVVRMYPNVPIYCVRQTTWIATCTYSEPCLSNHGLSVCYSYYTDIVRLFREPTMLPLVQPGTCIVDKQRSRGQISLILVSGSSIRNLPGAQGGPWQMGHSSTMEHLSEIKLGEAVLDFESGNNMLRGGNVICVEHTWRVPGRT